MKKNRTINKSQWIFDLQVQWIQIHLRRVYSNCLQPFSRRYLICMNNKRAIISVTVRCRQVVQVPITCNLAAVTILICVFIHQNTVQYENHTSRSQWVICTPSFTVKIINLRCVFIASRRRNHCTMMFFLI